MDFKLDYEDLPKKNKLIKRGALKMSKQESVKKESKKYSKTRGEHLKDNIIVALVIGIIAFALGVQYANGNQKTIENAVRNATPVVVAEPLKQ